MTSKSNLSSLRSGPGSNNLQATYVIRRKPRNLFWWHIPRENRGHPLQKTPNMFDQSTFIEVLKIRMFRFCENWSNTWHGPEWKIPLDWWRLLWTAPIFNAFLFLLTCPLYSAWNIWAKIISNKMTIKKKATTNLSFVSSGFFLKEFGTVSATLSLMKSYVEISEVLLVYLWGHP